MVVRISCMYSDDFDGEYHEEGERIWIDPNAISANFMILENEAGLQGEQSQKRKVI